MTIEIAIKFAEYWHSGQKRKYTLEDYVNHPISVSELLREAMNECSFFSEPAYIACVLHDVLEDTKATHQSILDLFGSEAFCYVTELTDVFTSERFPYLNRKDRKYLESERLSKISILGKCIKLCDLIDNTSSIVEHDKAFAAKYLIEKGHILEKMKYSVDESDEAYGLFIYVFGKAESTFLDAKFKLKNKI